MPIFDRKNRELSSHFCNAIRAGSSVGWRYIRFLNIIKIVQIRRYWFMLDFKIHKLQWSLSKKIKFFELPYPHPFQISFWMIKNLPRVRIELTAFRLWDWRAAYCATKAWYYKKLTFKYFYKYIMWKQLYCEEVWILGWSQKGQKMAKQFYRSKSCRSDQSMKLPRRLSGCCFQDRW